MSEPERAELPPEAKIPKVPEQFFNSPPIVKGISEVFTKLTGRAPTSEQTKETTSSARERLLNFEVLGQPVLDMVIGSLAGGGTKALAKWGLAIAGVGGLPVAPVVGAAAGTVGAVTREYLRQRKEGIEIEEDKATGIRARLKNEIRRIRAADKTQWRNAAIRGALFGAVGGVVGEVIVDKLSEELGKIELARVFTRPEAPLPSITTPNPTAEALATPLPQVETPPALPVTPPPLETPQIPEASVQVEPISPTRALSGAIVSGSVTDNNLTYDNKPWLLLDNGAKNINHLFNAVSSQPTAVDQQALAVNLQKATALWVNRQLDPTINPDLFRVFHLSNGTANILDSLLDEDTLLSLRNLGIVGK